MPFLKRQAAGADSDNHVDEHPHEWLQTRLIDRFSYDVECDRLIAMHQIADPEIGSRYVVCDNRVAVNRQIGEGSREYTSGFFFRPVELVPCSARNQWVRFAALLQITEHLGPNIDGFLIRITEQPINGWQCSWRLFAPGAVEHVCDAASQQRASGLLPMCLKTAAIRVNDQVS